MLFIYLISSFLLAEVKSNEVKISEFPIVMFGNEVYTIEEPIRYRSSYVLQDVKNGFMSTKFYLNYIKAVEATANSPRLTPVSTVELDKCVADKLTDETIWFETDAKHRPRSLQVTTLVCHADLIRIANEKNKNSKERRASFVYDAKSKDEKLYILDLNSPLRELLTVADKDLTFAVDKTKKSCIDHMSEEQCLPFLNPCAVRSCENMSDEGYCSNCHKSYCGDDKISLLRIETYDQKELAKRARIMKISVDRILKANDGKGYGKEVICAPCPASTRLSDDGMTCLDKNNCDIFKETYTAVHGCHQGHASCYSCTVHSKKFKSILAAIENNSTAVFNELTQLADLGFHAEFANNLDPRIKTQLLAEFRPVIQAGIRQFEADELLCGEDKKFLLCDTNLTASALTKIFIKYSKFFCTNDLSYDFETKKCEPATCQECRVAALGVYSYRLRNFIRDNPGFSSGCGNAIEESSFSTYQMGLATHFRMQRNQCLEGKIYDCDLRAAMTPIRFIDFMRAQRYDCAYGTSSQPKRMKSEAVL